VRLHDLEDEEIVLGDKAVVVWLPVYLGPSRRRAWRRPAQLPTRRAGIFDVARDRRPEEMSLDEVEKIAI
jgi:hypothetical protein